MTTPATVFCSTPGHGHKPQHGRSGKCQACYRRAKRAERGLRKPGPAPQPELPRSRHSSSPAAPRRRSDHETHCCHGHIYADTGVKRHKDGRLTCAECQRIARSPVVVRRTQLKAKYGLTLEQYDEMLVAQDGGCKICGKTPEAEGKALAVDHDHVTGLVRGLLCENCNRGIGLFGEDVQLLMAAVTYLQWSTTSGTVAP